MVISEIKGRLGNAMFFIYAGKYASAKLNTDFYITINKQICDIHYYHEMCKYEFLNQITVLDDIDYSQYKIIDDNYSHVTTLPIVDNSIINGWFVFNQKFIDQTFANYIFKPSKEICDEIHDLYKIGKNTLSINVRRGDFLTQRCINGGWHSLTQDYYKTVYADLCKDIKYDNVIITSDDIDWCKENLTFIDNAIYADKKSESNKIFVDFYIPTLCKDNVISASTFSWWGAMLNQTVNKKVIMPYPWNTHINDARNTLYYTKDCIKYNIYNFTHD